MHTPYTHTYSILNGACRASHTMVLCIEHQIAYEQCAKGYHDQSSNLILPSNRGRPSNVLPGRIISAVYYAHPQPVERTASTEVTTHDAAAAGRLSSSRQCVGAPNAGSHINNLPPTHPRKLVWFVSCVRAKLFSFFARKDAGHANASSNLCVNIFDGDDAQVLCILWVSMCSESSVGIF